MLTLFLPLGESPMRPSLKVARIYTECTYSQNTQFVYQIESRFHQTGAARNRWVNDGVSLQIVRKYLVGNDCNVTMTGVAVNEKLASVTHQVTSSCLRYLRFSQSFQAVYVYLACAK